MAGLKTALRFVMVFSVLLGMVVAIGCGNSSEKQVLADFLEQYRQFVDEFSAADQGKKAELSAQLDGYKSKWSDMKMEHGGNVTPQALDELEKEFQSLTEKYAAMAGKS